MEKKDFDKSLDLTKLKPYGDTVSGGKVQVSLTLPVKDVVRSRAQRVWLSINTAFKNYTGSISSFIKQKLLFRAAPGG